MRIWHDADGWGVIDSEATPGGCWVHFSSVLVAGHRRLRTGQEVGFDAEVADQDGYSFRAVAAWPADQAPVGTDREEVGPSPAYRSSLTLDSGDADD